MSITKRIDSGRGHYYKLDGAKVDGVTSIISGGIPKPALTNWAAREAATFAANNLDTLADLDIDARIDLIKGAPWRDSDKAARRGTQVHTYAERIAAGGTVEVPEELLGHVDSYIAFLNDWNVEPLQLELVVINRQWRYMGTLDLIARLSDGQTWLLDIKTNRTGIFAETALQLAAYRHAETCLSETGTECPMPPVDACGAVWVRADGYDLVPVDAGEGTFRAFLYAQQVHRWVRGCKDDSPIGDVLRAAVAA